MALSIRWRLTLWNTAALAVLLLAFEGLVYGLLRHALYEQTDRTLAAAFGQLEQDPRLAADPAQRLRHWVYEWKEHENLFAIVYDGTGAVLDQTEELPAVSVLPAPTSRPGTPRLHDLTVPVVGRQRTLEGNVPLASGPATVRLMAPLAEVDHELGRLLTVLLTAVPVMLALSGGLGYVLARKALAPVQQLRRSTEGITADRLDRRLPIANPGDELGRLAQTFNALMGRLEHSFAEVRRFTADASHELRTPLTAIRAEAEVALRGPLDATDCRQLLGSILEECGRLTRLTDQLLALAREDAGRGAETREPVDMAALVREVAETMRPLAEARGLVLELEANGPVPVRGDPARLRQVFFNVLDNAIKYTPAGTIRVRGERRNGAGVVAVRDTGIGIPAEHLPRVFDRFYRVDKARSRAQGGTGLGLSIAQSIVAAHGGSIALDSAPGRGTTCTVTLPEDADA
jgi:heavy metal sensor kinase